MLSWLGLFTIQVRLFYQASSHGAKAQGWIGPVQSWCSRIAVMWIQSTALPPIIRCMNQLLYTRSTGSLGPQAFARIQTTQLIHSIQPASKLRFDGGEKEVVTVDDNGYEEHPSRGERSWAHQAGVNALALDVDGKLYVCHSSSKNI